ncbi:MAG TPA: gamma-glutamylcyclotransferase family protein [Pseudolabrys sp.]|nr:gamma-glutamylcyclotransferase family protein [Pseudolabrys sp.]
MSTAGQVIIFAYGSNMHSSRLKARTPSATPLGAGQLKGHALRWHKAGRDGSGKCDVEHTGRASDAVWGVVYTLDAAEKPDLDRAEALGTGYTEKCATIHLGDETIEAWLYVAIDTRPALEPYDWYKAFVVEGAREHALPADYIAALEAVAAQPDDDEARAALNARILAGP